MAMSTDRVRFTLTDADTCRNIVTKAAEYAFSMTLAEADRAFAYNQRIECRPSQFARFIIKRNELGKSKPSFSNRISSLNPELFTPECQDGIIDVSKRPRR